MNEHSPHYLGKEPLLRLMVRFSTPCVLSLLVSALYNIVDQIFIGNSRLSTLGNAATGVVFPVFVVAQAFAWCFGDGCAAYLNLCQGRRDDAAAQKAIGTGVTVSLLVSLLLMAVVYPLKQPLLRVFGASENTLPLAVEYLNVILLFLPCFILSNMMSSVIRADGRPGWAMASIVAGAAVNLILDPVFIFLCDWGMFGAALATGLGQLVSLLLCLYCFRRPRTFRLTGKSFLPDAKSFSGALKLGLSSFLTQLTVVAIIIANNTLLVKYGALSSYGVDIPIAVMSISGKVFTVVINLVVGIVLGCQPIVSYNMGAGNFRRVRRLYLTCLACTCFIGLGATAVFQLAPNAVVGLFGQPTNIPNSKDYWAYGVLVFRIFQALICATCVVKMSSLFFQAAGHSFRAVIASLIRDIFCFLPLIILLPLRWGMNGILWAAPISDAIALAVTVILTVQFFRALPRETNTAAHPDSL